MNGLIFLALLYLLSNVFSTKNPEALVIVEKPEQSEQKDLGKERQRREKKRSKEQLARTQPTDVTLEEAHSELSQNILTDLEDVISSKNPEALVIVEKPEQSEQKYLGKERQRREKKRSKEQLARTQPTDITFEEVHSKLSQNILTDLQKKEAWKRYRGKCVQWTGRLVHLDENESGEIEIGYKHLSSTITYDVHIIAPADMKARFFPLKKGSWYQYEGRLKSYGHLIGGIRLEYGCR